MPDRDAYDADPFGPALTQVIVERMRFRLRQRVSAYVAEDLKAREGKRA